MEQAINALGIAIIAGKYAVFILLAGFTITTGAIAEPMLLAGIESNE